MTFAELPLWKRLNWINTPFLVLSPPITIALIWLYFHTYGGLSLSMAIFTFVYCLLTSVSITGGYHRLFAHRSYAASAPLKFLYLFFGAGALQGSALKWSTDHRRHHRSVDTEDDPYNIQRGFLYAHIGWVFFKEDPKYSGVVLPDLSTDALVVWQDKYIAFLTVFVGFGLPTLIGWALGSALGGLAFGGFFRIVFTHHSTFFINSLCHYVGKHTYNDRISARDSTVMSFLAYGEGYHNFHHHFQTDYRNGIHWYHWDPTKWWINSLTLCGWTRNLKRTPAVQVLKARLQMDEKILVQRGIYGDKLAELRGRMEASFRRMKEVRESYRELKKDVARRTREQLHQLEADFRLARLEFKASRAQWGAYLRQARKQPAY